MTSYKLFATKKLSDIYTELCCDVNGLSDVQAHEHSKKYGPNKISVKEIKWWQILLRQFTSPFVYILIFASLLALYLGETIDSIFIASFVLIGAILGFIQEYNSQKSVELLKKFLVDHAKILRGGVEVLVKSEEIVPGDICILEPGNIICADIRFIRADNLLIDESILTGESMSISKTSLLLNEQSISGIHDAINMGFSGTTVMQGRGVGIIIATGKDTQIGGITKLTAESEGVSTFEKGISKLSKWILKIILTTLALVFIVNFLIKKDDSKINFADIILFSIALAVSVIPETLPVISALSFSKGSLALAKKHVVVKRLSAVEDLGSIEVLCTDKTGTITENKMSVSAFHAQDENFCLSCGVLTSSTSQGSSSFDVALFAKIGESGELNQYQKINELPFDPERKRNSVLVSMENENKLIVRGAPETIVDLCVNIGEDKKNEIFIWISEREMLGERVIALAMKKWTGGPAYSSTDEIDLEYVGAISFSDPIKESAIGAIKSAEELGVRIVILTGDSKNVAISVAKATGIIKSESEVLIGGDFEKMSEAEQLVAVENVNVFARVSPEQKYRVIELLEKKYEVGFLGDGINDAPALKLASVALAVNTASDIARSASDIVLLNPSLSVIIDGIKGGREIFANMVKYLKTTLISNFGNFYAIAIAMIASPFLPMLPVQVLLLNLLTDTPMIAISFDKVDKKELQKPRSYNIKEIVLMSLIFAVINAVFVFLFFVIFFKDGAEILQTNLFIGSVLIELVLIFAIRTKKVFWKGIKPSKVISILCIIPASLAIILPFTEWGEKFLRFSHPSLEHIGIILLMVVVYFAIIEISKIIYYKVVRS
ncbi:MAG: cation-transporting P-type ATPase [Candidatus Pacebacteria bacterium]|nr:cation-transporting P-type ATPase [Candidatus Paceibacterota bacterium]